MMAGTAKVNTVSLRSGIGHIRAGTVAVGTHVIAIESIATIRIVRGQRSWWLALLGVLVSAGAATQLNAYGAFAIAGIGFGAALILGNLAQRVESGLSIGSSDGCATLIVSRDQAFLQRLLLFLVERIDTGDRKRAADFDLERASLSIAAANTTASASEDAFFARPSLVTQTDAKPLRVAPAPIMEDSADDAIFAEPESGAQDIGEPPTPPAEIPAPTFVRMPLQAKRQEPSDRLLDIGWTPIASDVDWLERPGSRPPRPAEPEGGAARILLALLILVVLGASVFAVWYFSGDMGLSTAVQQGQPYGAPIADIRN